MIMKLCHQAIIMPLIRSSSEPICDPNLWGFFFPILEQVRVSLSLAGHPSDLSVRSVAEITDLSVVVDPGGNSRIILKQYFQSF